MFGIIRFILIGIVIGMANVIPGGKLDVHSL